MVGAVLRHSACFGCVLLEQMRERLISAQKDTGTLRKNLVSGAGTYAEVIYFSDFLATVTSLSDPGMIETTFPEQIDPRPRALRPTQSETSPRPLRLFQPPI